MSDDFQGRGGSPWGTPPPGGDGNGSGRGPRPPDIEELIRNFQNKIETFGTAAPIKIQSYNIEKYENLQPIKFNQ